MKSLILILIVAPLLATAQPLMFEEVVYPGDSTETKEELYNRAKSWFVDTYNDSRAVIHNEDKESGVITGKAIMRFVGQGVMDSWASGNIDYDISIFLKDGRYKYVLDEFVHVADAEEYRFSLGIITADEDFPYSNPSKGFNKLPDKWYERNWDSIRNMTIVKSKRIINSLKSHMTHPTEMEEDDW